MNTTTKFLSSTLKHHRVIVNTGIFLKGENLSAFVGSMTRGFTKYSLGLHFLKIIGKPQQLMG